MLITNVLHDEENSRDQFEGEYKPLQKLKIVPLTLNSHFKNNISINKIDK